VQEITAGVDNVIQLLQQLPPSKLDQTLVFPTCLAGCMTDNQGQRQYLISRVQGASNMLNLQQTRSSMEGVWQRRDLLRQAGTASWEIIDWRESLRDHGLNLLLV
jgi:C6 transcription factor Pro1